MKSLQKLQNTSGCMHALLRFSTVNSHSLVWNQSQAAPLRGFKRLWKVLVRHISSQSIATLPSWPSLSPLMQSQLLKTSTCITVTTIHPHPPQCHRKTQQKQSLVTSKLCDSSHWPLRGPWWWHEWRIIPNVMFWFIHWCKHRLTDASEQDELRDLNKMQTCYSQTTGGLIMWPLSPPSCPAMSIHKNRTANSRRRLNIPWRGG